MKKYSLLLALTVQITLCTFAHAAYYHEGEADAPKFVSAYPSAGGTKLDSCALCHSGGEYEKNSGQWVTVGSCQWCHLTYGYDGSGDIKETINPYGTDYRSAGRNVSAFASIEGNDSDGDSYTNKQEIDALSYPGDVMDDPTKIPAPSVTYTLSELESLTTHTQFLLMNTTRSGDWYAEYQGVPMLDLLRDAGVIEETTSAVTVFAPDGYFYTYELKPGGEYYYIDGTYPQAQYYYDVQADKANGGWCDYSAPSCTGRNPGDLITVEGGLQFILAYKRDGVYLEPGILDEENRIPLDREGPFRAVPPQMVLCPPDQASVAENQDVIWPFDENLDHNAGFSARTVVAIRIEPLPEGTSDFNWYEGGWDYVDDKAVIIYGNLASGGIQGMVTVQETTQPIENAEISTDTGGYAATTDNTGSFAITGMKVGTYTVRARAAGYQSQSSSVTVTQNATETVNFSLVPGSNECPIESMLSKNQRELALFRGYRDRVLLQSNLGKQYIKHYYTHAAELTRLLVMYSEVRTKAFEVLRVISPSLENVLAGNQLTVTKTQFKVIESLVKELKKVASPKLRKTICQFEKDVKCRNLSKEISIAIGEK